MDYQHIRVERQDNAFTLITIDREKALNALNAELLDELNAAVADIQADSEVRCVALTGAGKAFVAGADIAAMRQMGPRQAYEFASKGAQLGRAIEAAAVPFIAAVNGFALGGGCELALSCDFIYASSKAKLGQPEVKLGVIPGFGGTQRLSRRVGVAKAKELVFTGDLVGAEEAHRIGLVDAVCAPDELMDKVRETAKKIASNGPLAIAQAKRLIHVGQSATLEHANMLEMHAFAGLFDTEDQQEGMSAFLEKRDAEFRGR